MTQILNLDNWQNGFADYYGTPLASFMETIPINDYIKVQEKKAITCSCNFSKFASNPKNMIRAYSCTFTQVNHMK